MVWCVSLCLFLTVVTQFVIRGTAQAQAVAPKRMAVTAAEVLGRTPTASTARYTVVEWADYECPPCRNLHKTLPATLARHKDRIHFEFRNYPLLKIHPRAWQAAVAAEAAREQGKFDAVHDALFTSTADLTQPTIEKLVAAQGVDMARFRHACKTSAPRTVKRDLQQAEALGLEGTPSLLLCRPDGTVYKLTSPTQLDDLPR